MSRKETPTKKARAADADSRAEARDARDGGGAPPAGAGRTAAPFDEERARLAAIVESSSDAIISKTLEGTITSWNAAAGRLYGYAAEEVVGRHISVIVPEELKPQLDDILARIRRGEKVEQLETVRVRKDGSRVEVAVSVSPVRDASGATVGAATIARDIARRKRREAELARRVHQAALGAEVGAAFAEGGAPVPQVLQRCAEAV
ncbi:MAG TPA: PAS domain S-box protein, partial [Pyrinomonadaceae bacterium]|nr:PAS domain S-box protein [Pyrinomonadaceae bacterium]